jgi:hypothetical protein
MSEILGLVDALESFILDGKKIPLTEKVIINETQVLQLIDKIRLVVESKEKSFVRKTIDVSEKGRKAYNLNTNNDGFSFDDTIVSENDRKNIQNAELEACKLRDEANEYADYVLANLQLMLAKLQKNMVGLEKSIEDGREMIEKKKRTPVLEEAVIGRF